MVHVPDTTMREIATAAGLGAAALEYISESPELTRQFMRWCERKLPAGPQPATSAQFGAALSAAALACAGLHGAFKDAA
jgi:hypothetical protein